MHRVPGLLGCGVALMAGFGRRIRLPGMLNSRVVCERYRIARKRDKHGQGRKTRERAEVSVHSVILREPTGTNHEIARSVRVELHARYHIAFSWLSRFGNIAKKMCRTTEQKTFAHRCAALRT
jgi:hypothetical protein